MATKKSTASSKVHVRPLGDRVLVKPLSSEDLTKKSNSGIILPETSNKERPEQGLVIAVGAGKLGENGEVTPVAVSVGERVLFSKFGPDEVTIDDEEYLVVSESNILAVVE